MMTTNEEEADNEIGGNDINGLYLDLNMATALEEDVGNNII
jgi:hypothetical protein